MNRKTVTAPNAKYRFRLWGKEKQMAISTCSKCGGHSFELALFTPIGDSRKLTLVQCSACGTAVGALDPSIGPQIDAVRNQIAAIDQKLARIAATLRDVR